MYFNNTTPATPFQINQPEQQFIQVAPGQLHFQLNLQVHPSLAQFLPLIGTCAIEAVQQKAGDNQLRMFLFNQMARQGYQNNDFMTLCKSIATFAELSLAKNVFRDQQSAIYDASPKVVEMFAAENLRTFPQLQQMIDPMLLQRCQATLAATAMFANEIAQYQRQVQSPHQPNQGMYGGYNQGMQPQTTAAPPWYQQNQNTGPVQANSFYGAVGNQPTQNTISPFNNGNNNTAPWNATPAWNNPSNQGSQPVDRFSVAPVNNAPIQKMPEIVQAAQNQSVQQTVGIQAPEGIYVKATETKFKPSRKYPYDIAYDDCKYDLYYLIEADGSMKPTLKPVSEKEQMDRNKHFKGVYEIGHEQRVADFMQDMETKDFKADLASQKSVTEEGIIMNSEVDIHKTAISAEEIWTEVDAKLHQRKTNKLRPSAEMVLGFNPDVFVSDHNPRMLADKLAKCESFIEACNVLKDAKAAITVGHKAKADSHIYGYLNDRLTENVNHFVTKKLGLKITIDSFVDDSVSLIDFIEQQNGEIFVNALRNAQTKLITSAVYYFDGQTHEDMLEIYVADSLKDAESVPFVTFFSMVGTYSAVNLFYSDLSIGANVKDLGIAVFRDHSPLLYSLADKLYRISDEIDETFDRHYVRTLDRKVLEIYRSQIDPNTYLVSKVK